MNALKHALTGATIFLPTDKIADFHKLKALLEAKFNAETDPEKLVVHDIVILEWRLQCIPQRESAIFLKGRCDGVEKYLDLGLDESTRYELIDADTQVKYGRDLGNLTLQQGRLHRDLQRRTAELKALRQEREAVQTVYRNTVMQTLKSTTAPLHEAVGSEFSHEYLLARLAFWNAILKVNVVLFDRTWSNKSSRTPS